MNEGELVFLRYRGDPAVVHTRLLLGRVFEEEWVVCTSDHDIYTEDLSPENPDLPHRWHSPDGRVPRGVPARQIYAFAPMEAAEYTRILRRGRREVERAPPTWNRCPRSG